MGNDDAWIESSVAGYINNSMVVGSPQWKSLLAAAKQNNIYLALGYSERTNSSIYMAQAIISNTGTVLHRRHKVRPSGGERNIWSDGQMSGIRAIDTPYGRWGILECWEYVTRSPYQDDLLMCARQTSPPDYDVLNASAS